MRISSGFSEISFPKIQEKNAKPAKIYSWPLYNAGKVNSIKSITRRTDDSIIYTKPSARDAQKIIDMVQNSNNPKYTQSGSIDSGRAIIQRGSLFDALA